MKFYIFINEQEINLQVFRYLARTSSQPHTDVKNLPQSKPEARMQRKFKSPANSVIVSNAREGWAGKVCHVWARLKRET